MKTVCSTFAFVNNTKRQNIFRWQKCLLKFQVIQNAISLYSLRQSVYFKLTHWNMCGKNSNHMASSLLVEWKTRWVDPKNCLLAFFNLYYTATHIVVVIDVMVNHCASNYTMTGWFQDVTGSSQTLSIWLLSQSHKYWMRTIELIYLLWLW